MRLRLICAAVVVVAMATAAATAFAKPGTATCSGTADAPGVVGGGTYSHGLTVTGTCFFVPGANIRIIGDLTVAPGASLDAHDGTVANVRVVGDVIVGVGGTVGLGDYGAPTAAPTQKTVVEGSIIADQPETLYLSEMTVKGSIVSEGGTGGAGINFPLKNLTVGGNITLEGWNGYWIGLFRSTVGGNVIFSYNVGTALATSGEPDSSEVASNTISGNLTCYGNSPAAQLGDSVSNGNTPNVVGGQALGQCAGLVVTP